MTALRGLTDAVEAKVMDLLGDEITYTPQAGSPRTFNAWVRFETDILRSPGSAGTKSAPEVEVRMADVPDPVVGVDTITIALRPGVTYTPSNRLEGDTGETWVLPLKKIVT